ncbi:zinc-dependent alcohol dehydrogenase family protein [Rugamonas sp.]|uniref:zinc-dependent alcohol dehydrogenase family protein n=1 Tax=Rugamonas sp. TaxID=1926287 RepID=UPI0025CD2E57|nr:zinc-dependent alcohol dehydrogenase family protein [Rugamonas sp.]
MSKIVGFTEYGGPDVLTITDIVVPAPAAAEVQIAVKAIGLNRAESMWRTGVYVEPVRLPARLGYEVSGVVTAVGADVSGLAVGDRVSTMPAFSQNDYGLYGELVNAPAHAVVKVPASLSFNQATALWNMFVTPYGALVESKALSAGQSVLIPAASSAVGLGAIQVTNLAGGVSIALTRTSAKRDQLLAAGAQFVIATEEQDLVAEVLRITGGKGADLVFEPVGGAYFPTLIEAMAPGATMFIYGALSPETTPLPLLSIILKQPVIRGFNLFGITTNPARQKAAADYIFAGIARGALQPIIARTFPFSEIVASHRYLETNQHFGKIIVEV